MTFDQKWDLPVYFFSETTFRTKLLSPGCVEREFLFPISGEGWVV